MKCLDCGYDNTENARFCERCGSALDFNRNSLSELLFLLLNDNIFMALCILYSVSVGFSVISGNIPIVGVIMTIFLWMVFTQRKNGSSTPNYFRYMSGTIFASYVVNWVFCCIMALSGLLFAILPFVIDTTKLWHMFYSKFHAYIKDYYEVFDLIANFSLLFFAFVFIAIAAVIACLNIFGMRTIHRFAQSIYKNLEYGQINLVKRSAAQTWIFVFGILHAVSAASALTGGSLFSFLNEGCLSAVFILGSILVNKYFGNIQT